MSLVRVNNIAVSLDGYATGEGQTREAPFGHAGERLHPHQTATRLMHRMMGLDGGSMGIDDAMTAAYFDGVGAEIMGRNKFGPIRGEWDEDWRGWWGEDPPFHTPVFVLTHYPREPLQMQGGTTFHFIDASPQEALEEAQRAAGGLDVRIGGGPTTIRQFLAEDLVDYMHVVIVPIVLGRGESLWEGLELLEERFDIDTVSSPSGVTHLSFTRRR